MSGPLVAVMNASSSAQAVLISLIASIVLLSFRAWSQSSGSALTRRMSWVLDMTILVLLLLFFVFVIIRFKTLA